MSKGNGKNGRGKLQLSDLEPYESDADKRRHDCTSCEWAAMTHENNVRLMRLEEREGKWLAEELAVREALADTRMVIGGEIAALASNMSDIVAGLRDEIQRLRADMTGGFSAMNGMIATLTETINKLR